MTHLVVDAMNVVGSRPDGWWHDRHGAILDLVARIRDAAPRLDADRITVVADGRGQDDAPGIRGVALLWAGGGPDAADDRIVALLRDARDDTSRTLVVTADRRLRDRVREIGAAVEGPRTFLDRLDGHGGGDP